MTLSRRQFMNVGASAAAAGLLASCSKGPSTRSGGTSATTHGGNHEPIGLSMNALDQSFPAAMVTRNKAYAGKMNYRLVVTNALGEASKQISDIQSLISQGIKVIIVSPVQQTQLNSIIKSATDKGIKIITVSLDVTTPVTEHIGSDNALIGHDAATFMGKELGGKGNIIEIQGVAGSSAQLQRHDAFSKVLKENYPNVKVVDTGFGNWLRQPAYQLMEDMIQRFKSGQIQGVYAQNDEMALGAILALKQANRLNGLKIVSIDGTNAGIDAIKAGQLTGTFAYSTCAPEAIQQAIKVLDGNTIPKLLTLPAPLIDSSNVAQWIGKGV